MKKAYVLDVTLGDIPEEVKEAVVQQWADLGLGNDYCYLWHDWDSNETISTYLWEQGIEEDIPVLLHYWW